MVRGTTRLLSGLCRYRNPETKPRALGGAWVGVWAIGSLHKAAQAVGGVILLCGSVIGVGVFSIHSESLNLFSFCGENTLPLDENKNYVIERGISMRVRVLGEMVARSINSFSCGAHYPGHLLPGYRGIWHCDGSSSNDCHACCGWHWSVVRITKTAC